MKISKYTFIFDVENIEFYIYSTLSNALVEIDNDSYRTLLKAKKDQSDVLSDQVGNELYDLLTSKRFIVESDIDSFLFYKSIIINQRADDSYLHLTISPTMDCCFNCYYCFEKYKENNYMSEEVIDSIIRYINLLDSRPEVKLTWFGGEPLMALSQMVKFYKKLVIEYKKPHISNIITTGFHMDEKAIEIFKVIDIKHVQITLDGLKDTHNKIKFTPGCSDVFNKVLDNAELLLKTSDIHVIFRINLTKQNVHEYIKIYGYLVDRFKHYKHKGISPAFVLDRGATNISKNGKSLFFQPDEAAEYVLELYTKYGIHSPFLSYPSRFFNECAIKNGMAVSFDPEGYAYKCWELIGNKKYAIGQLDGDGKLKNINHILLNRHLYGADPLEDSTCSKCNYLPVCNGGCPIQREENIFEGRKNCCCTFYKGRMKEFLKIHLQLKKAGIENNHG